MCTRIVAKTYISKVLTRKFLIQLLVLKMMVLYCLCQEWYLPFTRINSLAWNSLQFQLGKNQFYHTTFIIDPKKISSVFILPYSNRLVFPYHSSYLKILAIAVPCNLSWFHFSVLKKQKHGPSDYIHLEMVIIAD